MKMRSVVIASIIATLALPAASTAAFAYCGVIQESAIGKTAQKASQKARSAAMHQIKKLRRQHGQKLQAEDVNLACLGGAVAIDANGNQMEGKPSCTATVGFCVNP